MAKDFTKPNKTLTEQLDRIYQEKTSQQAGNSSKIPNRRESLIDLTKDIENLELTDETFHEMMENPENLLEEIKELILITKDL